jgi:hypothetical protein
MGVISKISRCPLGLVVAWDSCGCINSDIDRSPVIVLQAAVFPGNFYRWSFANLHICDKEGFV